MSHVLVMISCGINLGKGAMMDSVRKHSNGVWRFGLFWLLLSTVTRYEKRATVTAR